MKSSADEAKASLSWLGKEIKSVDSAFKDMTAGGIFKSQAEIDKKNMLANFPTDIKKDVKALEGYIKAVKNMGKNDTLDGLQTTYLSDSTDRLKEHVRYTDIAALSSDNYKTKQIAEYNALKLSTAATWQQTAAKMALNAVMGLAVAAIGAFVIWGINKLLKADQDAIDKANELAEAYNNAISDIKSNMKTLGDLEKDFKKLSAGVDKYGNNISLTTDEYSEYRDIVQEIVGISPELLLRYDKEGSAIANNNGLLEEAIRLQKEKLALEREEAVDVDNLWGRVKGSNVEYKKLQKELKNDTAKTFRSLTTSTDSFNVDENEKRKSFFKRLANQFGVQHSGKHESIWSDFSLLEEITDILGENASEVYRNMLKQTDLFTRADLQIVEDYIKDRGRMLSKIENQAKKLNTTLQEVPLTITAYDNLSDEQKTFVTEYINGFDITPAIVNNKDAMAKIKAQILDFVYDLSNSPETKIAITDFYSIGENIPISEWKAQIAQFVSTMAEALNMSEEDIKLKFGITVKEDQIDTLINDLSEKLPNIELENLSTLPINDLKIAYENLGDVGEYTFEQLIVKIDEWKRVQQSASQKALEALKIKQAQHAVDTQEYKDIQQLIDVYEKRLSGIVSLEDAIEAYTDDIDKAQSAISKLLDIEKEMAEGVEYNTLQYIELITQNAGLIEYTEKTANGYKIQKGAALELAKAEAILYQEKLKLLRLEKEAAFISASGNTVALDIYKKKVDTGDLDYSGLDMFKSDIFMNGEELYNALFSYIQEKSVGKALAEAISSDFKNGINIQDSTDLWKAEAEKIYSTYKHLRSIDQMSTEDYIEKLSSLNKKYYVGKEKYLEDERRLIEEIYGLQSQLSAERIADIEHEVYMLQQKEGTEESQIASYRKIQEEIIKEIERFNSLEISLTNDKLQEQEKLFYEYAKKISDIEQNQLNTAQTGINDLLSLTITMLQKKYDMQKQGIQDQLDSLKDSYDIEKEQLESLNDIRTEGFDSQEKALEDIREQQKKNNEQAKNAAKEEIDAYKEKIDAQLKLLRLKEDEHDYERDLASKQKDVNSLQNELLDLQYDDSAESRKRKLEIEAELATKLDDLSEFQHDKEISRQEDALNDELDRYEKLYDSKVDAIDKQETMQEEVHESQLERIKKEEEAWAEQHKNLLNMAESRYNTAKDLYDKQLKDIEEYLSIEKNIRNEAMTLMESRSDEFYADLINYNDLYGDGIEQNVKNKWETAYTAMQIYNLGQQGVLATLEQIAVKMASIKSNAAGLGNSTSIPFVGVDSTIGAKLNTAMQKAYADINRTWDGKAYSTGGVNTTSGLAQLHGTNRNVETIFNATDGKKLYNLIHNSSLGDLKNRILPNITGINGVVPQLDINMGDIIIQGNADNNTVTKIKQVKTEILNEAFKRINKHINMGGVGKPNFTGI